MPPATRMTAAHFAHRDSPPRDIVDSISPEQAFQDAVVGLLPSGPWRPVKFRPKPGPRRCRNRSAPSHPFAGVMDRLKIRKYFPIVEQGTVPNSIERKPRGLDLVGIAVRRPPRHRVADPIGELPCHRRKLQHRMCNMVFRARRCRREPSGTSTEDCGLSHGVRVTLAQPLRPVSPPHPWPPPLATPPLGTVPISFSASSKRSTASSRSRCSVAARRSASAFRRLNVRDIPPAPRMSQAHSSSLPDSPGRAATVLAAVPPPQPAGPAAPAIPAPGPGRASIRRNSSRMKTSATVKPRTVPRRYPGPGCRARFEVRVHGAAFSSCARYRSNDRRLLQEIFVYVPRDLSTRLLRLTICRPKRCAALTLPAISSCCFRPSAANSFTAASHLPPSRASSLCALSAYAAATRTRPARSHQKPNV